MNTQGKRLKAERERLQLSQTAFGEIGGVGKRAQINYESDERKPDAAYLEALSKIGVDVQYVVTGVRSDAVLTAPKNVTDYVLTPEVIAQRVSAVMAAKGLSEQELADIMGVPSKRVRTITSGRSETLELSERLALVGDLRVSTDWLIKGRGEMFIPTGRQRQHERQEPQTESIAVSTLPKQESGGISVTEVRLRCLEAAAVSLGRETAGTPDLIKRADDLLKWVCAI